MEKRGLVRHITVPVSSELEVAEVTRRAAKLSDGGPVLSFEKVAGAVYPIITNLTGSGARLAWSLGLNHLEELDQQMVSLLNPAGPLDLGERLARLGETSYQSRYAPKQVRSGACQEVEIGLANLTFLRSDPSRNQPSMALGVAIPKTKRALPE